MSWKTVLGVAAVGGMICFSCGDSNDGAGGNGANDGGNGSETGDGSVDPIGTTPLTGHPRLLVRASDVDRLRSWAVPTNPLFAGGLDKLAQDCKSKMDAGEVEKDPATHNGYAEAITEDYAELFAFMSLISPNEADRADYAKRAHTLLMHAIDEAAKGDSDGAPFRDPAFATSDRSRWNGEAFGLTVDWIYGTLSTEDKQTIRTVFLRWSNELVNATTTDDNHPEPIGVVNDPKLTSDKDLVRWSANNYYAAHARNLGLMALAFDPADDADQALGNNLKSVTGAWLYVIDALMRGDMAGGLGAEGFEYSPQAVGYVAQLLAALYTSGRADPAIAGPQATFGNPFWDAVVPAYLHSLSPAPKVVPDVSYLGPIYSVAWFGDGDNNWAADPAGMFAAIGIHDTLAHNDARLSQLRWLEANTPPGGAQTLTKRAGDPNSNFNSILLFMLFDPAAPPAPDPHAALPLTHVAKGLGRVLARTSWDADASWFTFKLGWQEIDHQSADGNMFELWRKGEWLTKERTGYGVEILCSEYKNTLAIENDVPFHDDGNQRIYHQRGSQTPGGGRGDPTLLSSFGARYAYMLGDSTALYNNVDEVQADVLHASRSLVWLMPDRVVLYDRATSKTDGRFKRFWLNLPNSATLAGNLVTMSTPGGQKLFVRSLLPAGAAVTVEPVEPLSGQPAAIEPVANRLHVEVLSKPKDVRFLHVLQGADGNGAADNASVITSTGGTAYEGASINNVAVMFPVALGAFASTTYSIPAGTAAQVITGLTPGATYTVAVSGNTVTVTPNGSEKADEGGVVVVGTLP